ncbi:MULTISPECIES: nuclease-related domain-containing protein [unclassified Bradyrhizobium]|uniref:nuclease-related domain-containing protein n=1 Tax=Bradyrhizobium sp. USDA 4541 TaxID=2817704 RepID=UPI0020A56AB7|nr:NERD domain-containing protein [Bradyrhizobium sp. USDA 4541]MCP1846816.1 hypothetical protein [Bradyrhizobium sp. USDA 4541]
MAVHIPCGAPEPNEVDAIGALSEQLFEDDWALLTSIPRFVVPREIDACLLGPKGMFVLELKNYEGAVSCHAIGSWEGIKRKENPLDQAEDCAQKLKGWLTNRDPALNGKVYIDSIVVMTHPECRLTVDERIAGRVGYLRDTPGLVQARFRRELNGGVPERIFKLITQKDPPPELITPWQTGNRSVRCEIPGDTDRVPSKVLFEPRSRTTSASTKHSSPEPSLPPPVQWAQSSRRSNVRSPFSIRQMAPQPVIPGPDAYMLQFIQSTLRPEARPDLFEPKLTLQEILKDTKQQELFGLFIESFGGQQGRTIVEKFMDSDSNPATMTHLDEEWFQHCLTEFHKRSLLLKEMCTDTKRCDFEFMLKNEPAFGFLDNNAPVDRAIELIKHHMSTAFMRMSGPQLTRVIEATRANHDIRRSDYYRELLESVRAKLGSQIEDVPSIRDKSDEERKRMFEYLTPGFFERLKSKNSLSGQLSTDVLATIDSNRQQIMKVLAATISNDLELKREVVSEAITGKRVRQIGEGILELHEAQLECINGLGGHFLVTDDLRRRIRDSEFRRTVGLRFGKSWESMSPEEREAISYTVLQEEGQLPKQRRGFFGLWVICIFDAAFPDLQEKLANEFE